MSSGTTTISNSEFFGQEYGVYAVGSGNRDPLTVASSTFRNNTTYGIYALHAGGLSVTDSTFTNNTSGAGFLDFSDGLTFSQSGNQAPSGVKRGFIMASQVRSDQTWSGDGLPYIIHSNGLTVDSGKTLTIGQGAIVKFDGSASALSVLGTLNAEGIDGKEIYFTSLKDDDHGGDTNGTSGSPAAADWHAIYFASGSTGNFEYANVLYGGFSAYPSFIASNIYNNGGTITVSSSTVASSTTYGIRIGSGTTTVTTSEIFNQTYGVYSSGSYTAPLTVASSTLRNNTYGLSVSHAGTLALNDSSFADNSSGAALLDFSDGLTFTHSGNTSTSGAKRGFLVTGNIATSQTWTADGMPYRARYNSTFREDANGRRRRSYQIRIGHLRSVRLRYALRRRSSIGSILDGHHFILRGSHIFHFDKR
jgi:hypothetical protein